jgi:hypothetical protein
MDCTKHFNTVVFKRLETCNTAGEMLAVIESEYELNQQLGPISKLAFMQGLRAAVTMIKPPIKN